MRHTHPYSHRGARAARPKRENVEIVEFVQFIGILYRCTFVRSLLLVVQCYMVGRVSRVLHFTRVALIFHFARFEMTTSEKLFCWKLARSLLSAHGSKPGLGLGNKNAT